MINKNWIIVSIYTFLGMILYLAVFTLSVNAQTLYSCNNASTEALLYTIDPSTGANITSTVITLEGTELVGCNGMAKDPTTGVCWIILSPPNSAGSDGQDAGPRILATIDEETGVATEIGDTGEVISAIAFDSEGTLYAVTGDQFNVAVPKNPETLFILNKQTGLPTFFQTLGNGNNGESLAFNPLDGLLYHASGNPPTLNVNVIFETINPENMAITPINISGDIGQYDEQTALVHQSDNVFLTAQRTPNALHSITTDGVVTFLGDMEHRSKGLAFDCGVAPIIPRNVPTISEWGLIAMASILGIVGFMVIRRRKVTT